MLQAVLRELTKWVLASTWDGKKFFYKEMKSEVLEPLKHFPVLNWKNWKKNICTIGMVTLKFVMNTTWHYTLRHRVFSLPVWTTTRQNHQHGAHSVASIPKNVWCYTQWHYITRHTGLSTIITFIPLPTVIIQENTIIKKTNWTLTHIITHIMS